jgi:hypothetical protein
MEDTVIDSHSSEVPGAVWDLLSFVMRHAPVKGVILERDEDVPPLAELARELAIARDVMAAGALEMSAVDRCP